MIDPRNVLLLIVIYYILAYVYLNKIKSTSNEIETKQEPIAPVSSDIQLNRVNISKSQAPIKKEYSDFEEHYQIIEYIKDISSKANFIITEREINFYASNEIQYESFLTNSQINKLFN